MGSEWSLVRLGDYCSKIGSGATPKGGSSVYLDEGEISLIRSQNVYNNGFSKSGLVFITSSAADKLKNVIVESNDILLNITGDSVARVCMVDESYLPARVNQHVAIIRVDPKEFDARFVRYFLSAEYTQSLLLTLASAGATRNALTKSMIEDFLVPKPPLEKQAAIADSLAALDNKIALNRQINTTLESMAQALFKSWFVDFDPVIDNALAAGHEIPDALQKRAQARAARREALRQQTNKTTEANATAKSEQALPNGRLPTEIQQLFPDRFVLTEEMGWVPEGWEVKPLSSMIELIGGGTPKTSIEEYWGGDIPWFSVVDAPNPSDVFVLNTEKSITQVGLDNSSAKILPKGTTIISARGTVGKCAVVARPMAMNQSCYGLRGANGNADYFTYYMVLRKVHELQQRSHGSVFSTITRDTFKGLNVASCSPVITQKFDSLIAGQMDRILVNLEQIQVLSSLRDSLLPKLLSGQLTIPEAEQAIDEVK